MSSEKNDTIRRIIRSFPVQINAGLLVNPPQLEGDFSHVLVCGMGGSALAGRILKHYTRDHKQHNVNIYNNYDLPTWVDSSTLIVTLSYSGNTEETLSAFDKAREMSLPLIAVSTGGEIKKRATETSTPWLEIPTPDNIPHFQPRYSVPAQLGLLTTILASTKNGDLRENFRSISDIINPDSLEDQMKPIANAIEKRTPIIYTSEALSAVGYNWKIQMNETVKRHAFSNIIPEANHNEIEASDHKHFHAIFLRDSDDHPRTNQRIQLMEEVKRESGMSTTLVDLPGSTSLERHLNGIILGWWLAALSVEKSGINPTKIDTIESFKEKLNE